MTRTKKEAVEPSRFYASVAGRLLKGLRYERNLNTSDLATLCGWKSEEMIHRIERGDRSLELGDFFAICEYAGLTLGEACTRLIQACEYEDETNNGEAEELAVLINEPPPLRAKPKAKKELKTTAPTKAAKPPPPPRPRIDC